ncbi:hypothetical protein C0Q70_01453 [Pomacea canaliculata]|uniref:DUF4485 domain-containing protein n=1 Tax=Pomacea canaliculata TaxID=400727 RepID=A0A2T7PZJ3_POMCA|nr:hypothetical protein C0Q70_01453 [Pomacea canaliculata]
MKLAKTLQETNRRTRQRLQQRKSSVDAGKLPRARSLSPTTRAERTLLGEKNSSPNKDGLPGTPSDTTAFTEDVDETIPVFEKIVVADSAFSTVSALQQQDEFDAADRLCSPLSLFCQSSMISSYVEDLSTTGRLRQVKILTTQAPAAAEDVAADISPSRQPERVSKNDTTKAKTAAHNSLSRPPSTEGKSTDLEPADILLLNNVPHMTRTLSQQIEIDTGSDRMCRSVSFESTVSADVSCVGDVVRVDPMKVEFPSVGDNDRKSVRCPKVPLLTARSPELLRKLMEVTVSIGASRRRLHSDDLTQIKGSDHPESEWKSKVPEDKDMLQHASKCLSFVTHQNTSVSTTGKDLEREQVKSPSDLHETSPLLSYSASVRCPPDNVRQLAVETSTCCDISHSEESETSLDKSVHALLSTASSEGSRTLCLTPSGNSTARQPLAAPSASLSESHDADPDISKCQLSSTISRGEMYSMWNPKTMSPPADQQHFFVHDMDLRLVPLSAISIVVGTCAEDVSHLAGKSKLASGDDDVYSTKLEFDMKHSHENDDNEHLSQSNYSHSSQYFHGAQLSEEVCVERASTSSLATPSGNKEEAEKHPLTSSSQDSLESWVALPENGNEGKSGCLLDDDKTTQIQESEISEGMLSPRMGLSEYRSSWSEQSRLSSTSGIEGDCGGSPECTDQLGCSTTTCDSTEDLDRANAFILEPSEHLNCGDPKRETGVSRHTHDDVLPSPSGEGQPTCSLMHHHRRLGSELRTSDSCQTSHSGTPRKKVFSCETGSSLCSCPTPRDPADVSGSPSSVYSFCLLGSEGIGGRDMEKLEMVSGKSVVAANDSPSFRRENSEPSLPSWGPQKKKRKRSERAGKPDSDTRSMSCTSASSVDSWLSMSDTSSCVVEVMRYLSSSSKRGHQGYDHISRNRMKRNIEQRQQQQEFHRQLLQKLSQVAAVDPQQQDQITIVPPCIRREKRATADTKVSKRSGRRQQVPLSSKTEAVLERPRLVKQDRLAGSDFEERSCRSGEASEEETASLASSTAPRTWGDLGPNAETQNTRIEPQDDSKSRCAASKMESAEDAVLQMDEDFDKMLVDMKPHVLKLPQKADRQKCAVWIKKLCEPPSSGMTGRKNRNMYAKLMLHMLKRGNIQGPFDRKPEGGPLQPLPSYMSVYFDDGPEKHKDIEKLPDWVEGELAESTGSSLFRHMEDLGNPAATSTWVSHAGSSLHGARQRPHTSLGINIDKDPGLSPVRGNRHQSTGYSAHIEADMTQQFGVSNSTAGASLAKGVFLDDTTFAKPQDKEIALRTKMIEARYHEEKLKLQQKHDAAVQKILDRKNSEIEDVKGHYRNKIKELEEIITKLERKIQTLVKETTLVRETKDKQIGELKKMLEDTAETRRSEFEKKLHDLEADFEQQKFDLQKLHTRNIQEILDDTNSRLQRMETEYSQQASSTTAIIKELEGRVQQLTGEVDRTLSQRSLLEKEKVELQSTVEKLTCDLERAHERMGQLDRELKKQMEASEQEMRGLRNKTEASLEFLKQEQNIAASKAVDTITDLEQQVEYLKKALKDAEEHRQRQIRETEQVHQQDKLHLENLHDKQVRSMKKELEQLEQEMQRKMTRLEQLLQDKEAEVQKQKEIGRSQLQQAEKALEEFKLQVEKNQTRIYTETKQQIDQVQADLKKSKQMREKQTQDLTRQLESRNTNMSMSTVSELKEELVQANQLRKQQLVELGLLREEEKQKMQRDHEVELARCRTDAEQQRLELQKMHSSETERLLEKTNERLKSIEKEYSERAKKSAETMAELQGTIKQLRDDSKRVKDAADSKVSEVRNQLEEEKMSLKKQYSSNLTMLQHELESQRSRCHNLERQMQRMEAEQEEKITRIKFEHEEKLKGLLPSELKQELEDIIMSLKSQVNSLQQRAAMLQEELDIRLKNPLGVFGSRTSSPIKSSV